MCTIFSLLSSSLNRAAQKPEPPNPKSKEYRKTNINPFGPYYAGALRTAIASCFINGKIKAQQIDFVKEVISKFREAEIEHLGITALEKEELKSQ